MRLIRGIGSPHLNLPLDFLMHSDSQEADLSARRFEVEFRRTKEGKEERKGYRGGDRAETRYGKVRKYRRRTDDKVTPR